MAISYSQRILVDTEAEMPPATTEMEGAILYAKDTNKTYKCTGSAWVQGLSADLIGVVNGISSLGSDGKVPIGQLPASVAGVTGVNTGYQILSDATITTTDITTNNATSAKHGFLPKLSNVATEFLNGTGTYTAPTGGSTNKDSGYFKQIGTSVERYYIGGLDNATAMTTGAPTIGILRALPFIAPRGGTVDRLAIQVTTLIASGVGKCAIYNNTSDTNLYPSSLLVAGSEISTATTGMKTATINQVLTANSLYWLVYWAGVGAATIRCLSVGGCSPLLGTDNALGTAIGVGWQATLAYTTSFPSTFTAGGTVLTAVPIPAIGVRFSA